jgi:hypothetical protein
MIFAPSVYMIFAPSDYMIFQRKTLLLTWLLVCAIIKAYKDTI